MLMYTHDCILRQISCNGSVNSGSGEQSETSGSSGGTSGESGFLNVSTDGNTSASGPGSSSGNEYSLNSGLMIESTITIPMIFLYRQL